MNSTRVEVEVLKIPDSRFSITLKDKRIVELPKGHEYPVFEQDESGNWEFKLANPNFRSPMNKTIK